MERSETFQKDDEELHAVISIPLEHVNSAKRTIESIYGGTIKKICIENHQWDYRVKDGFVSFESPDVVGRALSENANWPTGESISISIEAERCSASHFDFLNSDCLLHVYRFLKPIDIANASEAYRCLSHFAAENIYRKYSTLNILRHTQKPDHTSSADELSSVMKHFGEYITDCFVSDVESANRRPQMRNFSFGRCALEAMGIESLRAPEGFAMNCLCCPFDWSVFWMKFSNLRSLTLYQMEISQYYLDTLVVNLEKLSLSHCFSRDEKSLIDLINRHGATLTSLSMVNIRFKNGEFYEKLAEIVPNLTHFKIELVMPGLFKFNKWIHLKYLQLIVSEFAPFPRSLWSAYFKSFNTLEELDLVMAPSNIILAAGQIPTLRVLSIRKPLCKLKISAAVSQLPNLKRLYVQQCSSWSDKDTIMILKRNRSVEEIVLNFCNYKRVSFPSLVEFLTKQENSSNVPRSMVRLFVSDSYGEIEDKVEKNERLEINIKTGLEDEFFLEPPPGFFTSFEREYYYDRNQSYVCAQHSDESLHLWD